MSSETIIFDKMKEIVYKENRPFSYKDFLSFSINGLYYSYKHGHIRNIFSVLRKKGMIDLSIDHLKLSILSKVLRLAIQ